MIGQIKIQLDQKNQRISALPVKPSNPKEKDFSVKVRIKMSDDGLISLLDSTLIEEYKVEEKVKKPKVEKKKEEPTGEVKEGEGEMKPEEPAKEEDEYEIKVKNKSRHTALPFEATSFY